MTGRSWTDLATAATANVRRQAPRAAEGGLLSYGPDLDAVIRNSAIYVDKILKGAKPADLPVEQRPKFDLVINLKTAKALRLTIPRHSFSGRIR
jgi:ABC-type uncharacterized transport system substrate-binding protein